MVQGRCHGPGFFAGDRRDGDTLLPPATRGSPRPEPTRRKRDGRPPRSPTTSTTSSSNGIATPPRSSPRAVEEWAAPLRRAPSRARRLRPPSNPSADRTSAMRQWRDDELVGVLDGRRRGVAAWGFEPSRRRVIPAWRQPRPPGRDVSGRRPPSHNVNKPVRAVPRGVREAVNVGRVSPMLALPRVALGAPDRAADPPGE